MNVVPALTTLLAAPPVNDLDEILIPIVAIVGGLSIPIVALTLAYRKQQLQARLIERAIEQGLSVEEIDELLARQGFTEGNNSREARQRREVPFRRGLVLFAIGAAFFLAENPHFVGARSGWTVLGNEGFLGSPGQFASYILMGIGLAFVASDLLAIFFGERKEEA
ncbi:MAG: hypothetical protein CMJ94_00020 [Planctomycetes bacterium]|nr:hypothetical protein [Planctomycetota bacterium]